MFFQNRPLCLILNLVVYTRYRGDQILNSLSYNLGFLPWNYHCHPVGLFNEVSKKLTVLFILICGFNETKFETTRQVGGAT